MRRIIMLAIVAGFAGLALSPLPAEAADRSIFKGSKGPGAGKKVVLISGDEEYRSEEGLPQLAAILAKHHGFHCTVLYALADNGEIDPNRSDNIPGLEALDDADLMIILTRFRDLPADQMKHIDAYVQSGKPIIGLRTATHAFNVKGKNKPYAAYSFNSKEWDGGFGRQVLGETWLNHHGNHKVESTRGLVAPGKQDHPITRGLKDGDIWGPTDVYGVRLPLPGDSEPIILGQVLVGMKPTDPPVTGEKNDPMMPVAWTKTFTGKSGKPARVFATTMGSSTDLESAGLRRLIVNAAYWALGMEAAIRPDSSVDIVGDFQPTPYGFNGYIKGRKPAPGAEY
ncbi:MAG: ThuA domain-containing protein [Isosphaeraceae bacterium]|nr:ThuA domain-containing protein [Isosphaeraceae bacterium]